MFFSLLTGFDVSYNHKTVEGNGRLLAVLKRKKRTHADPWTQHSLLQSPNTMAESARALQVVQFNKKDNFPRRRNPRDQARTWTGR